MTSTDRPSLRPRLPRRRARCGQDRGAAAVIVVLLTPVLFAAAGLVLDGGRAIAARQQAAGLAAQAARAGVDQLDVSALRDRGLDAVDPAAARQAACAFVRAADPGAGCQATVNGPQVQVTVSTRTSTVLLPLLGINVLHARSQGAARPAVGVRTEQTPR